MNNYIVARIGVDEVDGDILEIYNCAVVENENFDLSWFDHS